MRALSIDLAYKRYSDNGFITLNWMRSRITAVVEPLRKFADHAETMPEAHIFAARIDEFCREEQIRVLVLDGPQGWKSSATQLAHSRNCERELNTPGKTGLEGECKPRNYLPFIRFSVRLFAELRSLGWQQHSNPAAVPDSKVKTLFESFPHAAWRGLGLPSIGAKRKCTAARLAKAVSELRELGILITGTGRAPTHDDLQATVGGLGALSYVCQQQRHRFCGIAPSIIGETLYEGYIAQPAWVN